MDSCCTYLPYKDTGSFSKMVTDYLSKDSKLNDFYEFDTDLKGIEKAIEARSKYPVNRKALAEVLQNQYANLNITEDVKKNIDSLEDENTFTVCTAHQPNLLTGYLYFIYKILHAIKLAEDLNKAFPGKHFVPVYYMGSEDNDIDELGTFRYNGEKYIWDAEGQTGAVGRMDTKSLKDLLQTLFKKLGPPGPHLEHLKEVITEAYLRHNTIGKATQYLVNELFGRYGLVVLDADDMTLKTEFISVLKDDLLNHNAEKIVSSTIEKLSENYKSQAHPRPINLFYLKDQLRERIEEENGTWNVLNTGIKWNESELLDELQNHPERFSPNVILRGLYQETILPDVAFIGGGAECAYWLQLKQLFNHYNVFYPAIVLRQSVLWVETTASGKIKELGFDLKDIFQEKDDVIKTYFLREKREELNIDKEEQQLQLIIKQLQNRATGIDITLNASAEAVLTKIQHQLDILKKKMLRSEKKKSSIVIDRIDRLKTKLFPNNALQERVENFMDYYLAYGEEYFDVLLDSIKPLQNEFLVIEAKN